MYLWQLVTLFLYAGMLVSYVFAILYLKATQHTDGFANLEFYCCLWVGFGWIPLSFLTAWMITPTVVVIWEFLSEFVGYWFKKFMETEI